MNHRQHEAYFSGYDGLEKTRADDAFKNKKPVKIKKDEKPEHNNSSS